MDQWGNGGIVPILTTVCLCIICDMNFLSSRKLCSIFRGAEKFCIALELRQLLRDTKCDISC